MRAETPAKRARGGLWLRGIHTFNDCVCEFGDGERRYALRMRECDSGSFVCCVCLSWVAIKVVKLKLPVHPPRKLWP